MEDPKLAPIVQALELGRSVGVPTSLTAQETGVILAELECMYAMKSVLRIALDVLQAKIYKLDVKNEEIIATSLKKDQILVDMQGENIKLRCELERYHKRDTFGGKLE